MYNRNLLSPARFARVGGFDYPETNSGQTVRIHSTPMAWLAGIANVSAKPNINVYKPVTDSYT